jgi:hypothetical protein
MESWGRLMSRVRGEVNADFLPVTSDRTGFVRDSAEYQTFLMVMGKVMDDVKKVLQTLSTKKEGVRVSRALNEALKRVYRALSRNPDLSPFGAIPMGGEGGGIGGAALVPGEKEGKEKEKPVPVVSEPGMSSVPRSLPKKKKRKNPLVKRVTPGAVIKKVKFGQSGVTCCIDSFGEEGPEVFSEDTTIYVNKDHPLYRRESQKAETHVLNLARLITQEIALMHVSRNPRQAFQRQSKLLRDALVDE